MISTKEVVEPPSPLLLSSQVSYRQFPCCFSCAGIIPEEVVEPMPPLLRALCRRLTRWGILPAACEPNSAIINIYEAVSSAVVVCA